jgi:hypothetical protein
MHDIEKIRRIINEFDEGQSKKSLGKKYNISRATIKYWIDNREKFTSRIKKFNKFITFDEIMNDHNSIKEFITKNKEAYNYILGFYLGDGCTLTKFSSISSIILILLLGKSFFNSL